MLSRPIQRTALTIHRSVLKSALRVTARQQPSDYGNHSIQSQWLIQTEHLHTPASGIFSSSTMSQPQQSMLERMSRITGRDPAGFISNYAEEDAEGKKLKLFRYKGKSYPSFGDVAFSQLKDLKIRDDDLFLMGYPKTGCHWIYEVINMMRRREAKLTVNTKSEAFLDVCHPKALGALSSPRILNSHLTFDELPAQGLAKKTKIVLTVRNHKDTAVSLYNHHTKLFPVYGYDGSFKNWFPLFVEGRVDYGSFFDYYKNWDEAVKSNPDYPILVVAYEDMKEDQPREMKRIAKFLGIELTDDLIKSICEATGISTMKVAYNKGFNVRKGQVGDYKNWFTVAQDEYLDEVAKKKVSGISIYKPRFELP